SKTSITEVDVILQDIQRLAAEIPNCGFTWIPREGNSVADVVASLVATDSLQVNWSSNPPPQLKEIIRRELWRR
ncbi:hypothetical protein PIB30_075872, partial [Stylosanthes scabra]|nr:hypothetical protein [Stylosanthes scabra]